MLRIAIDDFLSTDVAQVVFEYLSTKEINERLNVLCHFLYIFSSRQLTEVDFRKGSLEELNVEFVAEEDGNIVNWILNT